MSFMSPKYIITPSPMKTTRATLLMLALLCALSTYGQTMDPFVTTWETTTADESIIIPTHTDGTYNYSVTWEDGGTPEAGKTGDASHTYATPGTHTVSITGDFPRIYFNNVTPNADKIRTIAAWGNIAWTSMAFAFTGCSKLEYTAMDVPNLSGVTDMLQMFRNATAFNGDLSNWDVSMVTNMRSMFNSATVFDGNLSNWNVSRVRNMEAMFFNATAFDGDISGWDVSSVTNMRNMFAGATDFNGDISSWDVGKVTDMSFMFDGATVFDGDISNWKVSKVTNMQSMFSGATAFNGDISGWDVSKVTNMRIMFGNTTAFNGDISGWDVSKVNNMQGMFLNATAFDGNLGNWDVSKVTDFGSFLFNAELSSENYDALLIGWNKLNLQNGVTFHGGSSLYTSTGAAARDAIETGDGWTFNDGGEVDMTVSFAENRMGTVTDIDGAIMAGSYDLAASTTANRRDDDNALFRIESTGALSFISSPDFEDPKDAGMNNIYAAEVTVDGTTKVTVSVSVTNIKGDPGEPLTVATPISDLSFAEGFGTRDIDLSDTFTFEGMLTLSVSESSPGAVSATIAGTMLTLTEQRKGSSVITVTAGDRSGGTVTDEFTVTVSLPFVTTWKTDIAGEMITIPTTGDGYNYTVNWGDGMEDTGVTGVISHEYATADTYRVSITGDFPRIYFNDYSTSIITNADKILTIAAWGDIAWTSMNSAFTGCSKLTSTAMDVPKLSGVTDMLGMFAFAIKFNQDLSNWNVSRVNNMSQMFLHAIAFNQDLSNWDVSKVNNMSQMFFRAIVFNRDLSNWDVSRVTNMSFMFDDATAFDGNISNWDVSKVTNMRSMFDDAIAFDGNISNWDVSKVTNMRSMFDDATAFDGNISNWNVSSVTNMESMFSGARAFNQDLSTWNVSAVTDFRSFLLGVELSSENYDALLDRLGSP